MEKIELKEEMREVDGVETVVYVNKDGEVVDNPDLTGEYEVVDEFTPEKPAPAEGNKEDVDETGVPWKNRAKEFERKFEAEKLKNQIASQSQQQQVDRIADYRKKLEEKGYSADEIDEKVEMLKIAIETANDNMSVKLKDISQPMLSIQETANQNKREALLSKFEKDSDNGDLVTKFKKDIIAELETIPLQYDVSPELMEKVIGGVLWKKKAFGTSTKSTKKLKEGEIVTEGSHPTKTKVDGVDISSDEFKEYVADQGFDISTPELKAKVVNAFKLFKKYTQKEG